MQVDQDLMQDVYAVVRLLDPVLAHRLRISLDLPEPESLGLTAREAEVSLLAVGGMSNQQIAGHLAISVRTVETHLRNTYQKVGIKSRRQLPRLFNPMRAAS